VAEEFTTSRESKNRRTKVRNDIILITNFAFGKEHNSKAC
jgi:hypothetical protein